MKGGKPQVTTTSIDPGSQKYVDQMRQYGLQYGGRSMPGLDPNFTGALDWYRNAAGVGQQGMNALGGDVNAANAFMNPYFAQMNPLFDQMRNSAASKAQMSVTSPFGIGSREGLASSSAIRDVNNLQTQANVGAFNEGMGRAQAAANFGFGANQSLLGAGDYLTNRQRNWDIGSLGLLNGGLGPTGQTQSTPTQSNKLNQLLGTAMTISSFIPGSPTMGWGAGVGAGMAGGGGGGYSNVSGPPRYNNP